MSQHTIETEIEIRFTFPGLKAGEWEVEYPMVEITFDYSPGSPAYTPRGEYAPIDPPEPAEIQFVSARLVDGKGLTPSPDTVQGWGLDYLNSREGYLAAINWVEYDR